MVDLMVSMTNLELQSLYISVYAGKLTVLEKIILDRRVQRARRYRRGDSRMGRTLVRQRLLAEHKLSGRG
jgi:hypothetical protein